jgi:hypothetical protein
MAIKYINIFQSVALKIFPNWYFWFENKPSGNPVRNEGMGSLLVNLSFPADKSG